MTIRVRALSAEEQAELRRTARSRTLCAGRVKRAQLVLLAAEGRKAGEIAEELRLHARTARFWLKRFNARGLTGLAESERPGRPPVYPAAQVGAVIEAALTRPAVRRVDARPFGHLLGREQGGRNAAQPNRRGPAARGAEVATGGDLVRRPRRSRLRAQKGAIEQLYTAPPAGSAVVCLDEMGPQASKSYPGRRLVRPDAPTAERAKQEIDYGRRGPAGYVFGALQPATGAALTVGYERRTVGNWIDFLGKAEGWIDAGVERVYAVLDNLNVHTASDTLLFSLAHPRWEFVFQPRYAAYLNLIEPWWKVLRSLALKGRRFEGWAEIEAAGARATAYWNAHRHPFVWGRRRRHRPPQRLGVAAVPKATAI